VFSVREWFHRLRLRLSGGRPFPHQRTGFPFVCFPGHPDSTFPYLYGADDEFEIELLRRWLKPADGFLDCGANIGLYSAAAASLLNDGGEVVAVEPGGTAREMLTETVKILGLKNVRILDVAVGDHDGETQFFVARGNLGTTSQSIICEDPEGENYEKITVPMLSLDRIASSFSRPLAAIKIDIEGVEAAALAAATKTLEAAPLWIVEVNPVGLARFGSKREDVIARFPESTYRIWVMPKFSGTQAKPRRLVEGETWNDAPFHNLIILPRSGKFSVRTSQFLRSGDFAARD
jgi:FkbM family methyltransferase